LDDDPPIGFARDHLTRAERALATATKPKAKSSIVYGVAASRPNGKDPVPRQRVPGSRVTQVPWP